MGGSGEQEPIEREYSGETARTDDLGLGKRPTAEEIKRGKEAREALNRLQVDADQPVASEPVEPELTQAETYERRLAALREKDEQAERRRQEGMDAALALSDLSNKAEMTAAEVEAAERAGLEQIREELGLPEDATVGDIRRAESERSARSIEQVRAIRASLANRLTPQPNQPDAGEQPEHRAS